MQVFFESVWFSFRSQDLIEKETTSFPKSNSHVRSNIFIWQYSRIGQPQFVVNSRAMFLQYRDRLFIYLLWTGETYIDSLLFFYHLGFNCSKTKIIFGLQPHLSLILTRTVSVCFKCTFCALNVLQVRIF